MAMTTAAEATASADVSSPTPIHLAHIVASETFSFTRMLGAVVSVTVRYQPAICCRFPVHP